MNKLKRISILIISTIFLFSCETDEGETNNDNEQQASNIVGRWQLINRIDNNEKEVLSDCQLKSIVEFTSNNSFKEVKVSDDKNDSVNCEYDGFGVSGIYKFKSNNMLELNVLEVIAVPVRLDDPNFIEDAKGIDEDAISISFEGGNLIMKRVHTFGIEGEKTSVLISTYGKTDTDFFVRKSK